MNDFLQTFLLNINVIVCSSAAVKLFFFDKKNLGLPLRVSLYFMMISFATVATRILTGEYYYADWSETVINTALCVFVFLKKDFFSFMELKNENK